MYIILLWLVVGLAGLWLGAEAVTRGGSGLATKIGLSESFVGMTILALGTGLPELIISITGAIEYSQGVQTTGLVIGNIVGSNIGNMTFVLGLAGVLKIIDVNKKDIVTNGSAMIASLLAFYLFAQDGVISKIDGMFLLMGFIFYMLFLGNNEKKTFKLLHLVKNKKSSRTKIARDKSAVSIWWLVTQFLVGSIIIFGASHLVLEQSLVLAKMLNIPTLLIGIIMIGIGSSLPELVISISAIFKGSVGLSVGNLIGSNVMNVVLALGGSAIITDWQVLPSIVRFDLPFMMISSIIVLLFLLTRHKLERKESFLILILYYGYIMLKLQGF